MVSRCCAVFFQASAVAVGAGPTPEEPLASSVSQCHAPAIHPWLLLGVGGEDAW